MITIAQLREYTNFLKRDIQPINRVLEIMDLDDVKDDLSGIKKEDNMLLYMVIPEATVDSSNQEAIKDYTTIHWLVMEKVDRSKGKKEMINIMSRTQLACIDIKSHIFNTARGNGEWSCGSWLREVFNGGDLGIKPLYHMTTLYGWHLTLTIRNFG
ncbi:hypothetical protein [Nonlabens dokdonensis]|uniref:hypothetical protein n=1 Tax=Nonlabens dokdonensis TaxID=328515 RepID=UPI0026F11A8C|nr:hypothetical protein [Nonlabens dokdonensis]